MTDRDSGLGRAPGYRQLVGYRHLAVLTLAALMLAFAVPARATTYCVDSTGLDTNTGIAPSCWKTVTHASATTFAAGDTLEFAQGQTFRSTTTGTNTIFAPNTGGTAGSPLTITSFVGSSGAGTKPILDGADCEGKATGDCAGATAVTSWALCTAAACPTSSTTVYYLPWTTNVQSVIVDNATGWPDNGGVSGSDNPRLAACWSSPCPGNALPRPANMPLHANSQVYAAGSSILSQPYPSGWWFTSAGGTSGSINPTCASGCVVGTTTVTDGGVTWVYEGDGYSVSPALSTTAQAQWWQDGVNLYLKLNPADSPNNHVIEVNGHESVIQEQSAAVQYITINGIALRHGGWGIDFRNTSASVCPNHLIIENSSWTQTGPSNIDSGQFMSGVLINGTDTSCTTGTSTQNQFINDVSSYTGDHGACITIQVGGGDLIQNMDCSHFNHGGLNFVGACNSGATICPALTNETVTGNYVHDTVASQGSTNTNGGDGLFGNDLVNILINKNVFANLWDPNFVGGQGAAISLNNGGGGTIENNTVYNAQYGYFTSGVTAGTPTGLVFENNLLSDIHAALGTSLDWSFTSTTELTGGTMDYNVYPTSPTNVAAQGATNYTFASWKTAGFESHGVNGNAAFLNPVNPFFLAPGSVGLGTALASLGNGSNIGANQLWPGGFLYGW